MNARDVGRGEAGQGYDREGGGTPGPRGEAARPRRPGIPLRKACLLAVWFLIALWFAWFKFGDHGLGDVVGALAFLSPTFVPVGFILYGSLATPTRRPVPRLPCRRREPRATPDVMRGSERRRA